MLPEFIQITLLWLSGGLIILQIIPRSEFFLHEKLIVFSAGNLLSTLFSAIFIYFCAVAGIKWYFYCVFLATLSVFLLTKEVLAFDCRYLLREFMEQKTYAFVTSVTLLIAGVLTSAIALKSHVPTNGWDTLWNWAPISIEFLTSSERLAIDWLYSDFSHPKVSSIIGIFSNLMPFGGPSRNEIYLIWWLLLLNVLLISYGFCYYSTGDARISALASYLTASIPLVENHVNIGGYAELFLAVSSMAAAALFTLASSKSSAKFLYLITTTLVLSLALYKNIGGILCAVLILGFLSAFMIERLSKFQVTLFSSLLIVVAISMLINGFSEPLIIGDRPIALNVKNLALIPENLTYSFFINSSFNTLPVIYGLAIYCVFWVKGVNGHPEMLDLVRPFIICCSVTIFFISSQLADYGFYHASHGNDTGGSRFFITPMLMLALCIGPIVGACSRQVRN